MVLYVLCPLALLYAVCMCVGISLACDIASVQARLVHLKEQYRSLLAEKKRLCEGKNQGAHSKTEES